MPRCSRITIAGVPLHLIQRGNNRQACFYSRADYHAYLEWLQENAQRYSCAIHAYALTTNHVHLLITPRTSGGAGDLMKQLGQHYVQYVNHTYSRSGTLWEGRFRSCLAWEEEYVLGCYRCIKLNPVRAKIIEHSAEYQWSSCRANAQSEHSVLLTQHRLYTALGKDDEVRLTASVSYSATNLTRK